MNAFDIIAENRYRAWEQAPQAARSRTAVQGTRQRKSFEAVLYESILERYDATLQALSDLDDAGAEALMEQARGLEMQLLVALERKEQGRLAGILQASLRERRARLSLGQ